jgi:hypothetical protein
MRVDSKVVLKAGATAVVLVASMVALLVVLMVAVTAGYSVA